jgi:hypothetical protein
MGNSLRVKTVKELKGVKREPEAISILRLFGTCMTTQPLGATILIQL